MREDSFFSISSPPSKSHTDTVSFLDKFIACVQTAVLIPTAVLETYKEKALKGSSPLDHDSMASVTSH